MSNGDDCQSLVKCLEAAISEPDLVADIIEACRLSNTSANDLAGWSLEDIASKLFLTEAEAAKLSLVCKQVNEGDMSALEPKPQEGESGATAKGAAAADSRDGHYPSQQHNEEDEDENERYNEERTPEPEDRQHTGYTGEETLYSNGGEDEATPTPQDNGDDHVHDENEEEQEDQNGEHQEENDGEEHEGQQEQEAQKGKQDGPAQQAALAAAAAAVPVPAADPPSRSRSLEKQGSMSSSKNAAADMSQLPAMEQSNTLPTFKDKRSSGSNMPSYLRPTTSFKSHTGKLEAEKSPSPDKFLSPSASISSSRKASTASSRLLAPTASYLTRVSSARKDSKAAREAEEKAERERKARELKKVMDSPQGQRVTKAEPFRFKTEEQPKSTNKLTTEERAFLEAQKSAWKRHEVPKHIKESRPIEGVRVHSAPKSPQEVCKPFQLASLDKHEKYRKMAEQRQAEEKKKEEESRRFHAQQLDRKMLEQPKSPKPRTPPPVTVSQGFHFSSEERIKHHKEVIEPLRKSKLSQAEREKLEAHERAVFEEEMKQKEAKAMAAAEKQREKELEKMDITEYRKSLTFKAGSLPSFRSPFRVDLSKSQRVTDSIEFNFHTDKKLGKPKSPHERESLAEHPNASQFSSSLRASTNQLPTSGSMRSSMRISSAKKGPGSLRNSTNSLPLSAQQGSSRPSSAKVGSKLSPGVEAH